MRFVLVKAGPPTGEYFYAYAAWLPQERLPKLADSLLTMSEALDLFFNTFLDESKWHAYRYEGRIVLVRSNGRDYDIADTADVTKVASCEEWKGGAWFIRNEMERV